MVKKGTPPYMYGWCKRRNEPVDYFDEACEDGKIDRYISEYVDRVVNAYIRKHAFTTAENVVEVMRKAEKHGFKKYRRL